MRDKRFASKCANEIDSDLTNFLWGVDTNLSSYKEHRQKTLKIENEVTNICVTAFYFREIGAIFTGGIFNDFYHEYFDICSFTCYIKIIHF